MRSRLPSWLKQPTSFQTGEESQEKRRGRGVGVGGLSGDTALIRKTGIPAELQSSCQNIDEWHQIPRKKNKKGKKQKQNKPFFFFEKAKTRESHLASRLIVLY